MVVAVHAGGPDIHNPLGGYRSCVDQIQDRMNNSNFWQRGLRNWNQGNFRLVGSASGDLVHPGLESPESGFRSADSTLVLPLRVEICDPERSVFVTIRADNVEELPEDD